MDISKADFITRQQSTNPSGRGGYKERALSDIFAKRQDPDDDLPTPQAKKARLGRDAEDAQPQKSREKEDDDQLDLNEFQILELHSENPLITYRGRVYEGNWARNIGTELLFTSHDENNPLPVIRQLDNGVDLLAASSARLMLTEKGAKPTGAKGQRRGPRQRFSEENLDELEGDELPPVPDPEPGASAERYEQGNFLTKLISLKKKMGETDEVTVIARLHDEGKKKQGKRPAETNPAKRPARGRGSGQGRGGGRPRGKGKGKVGGRAHMLELSNEDSASEQDTTAQVGEGSQPTPTSWSAVDEEERDKKSRTEGNSENGNADDMDVNE